MADRGSSGGARGGRWGFRVDASGSQSPKDSSGLQTKLVWRGRFRRSRLIALVAAAVGLTFSAMPSAPVAASASVSASESAAGHAGHPKIPNGKIHSRIVSRATAGTTAKQPPELKLPPEARGRHRGSASLSGHQFGSVVNADALAGGGGSGSLGAASWSDSANPPDVLDISCASSTKCWAAAVSTANLPVVEATTDGGAHWAAQSVPAPPHGTISTSTNWSMSISCLSGGDCVFAGSLDGPGNATWVPFLFESTDGSTWTDDTTSLPSNTGAIWNSFCFSAVDCELRTATTSSQGVWLAGSIGGSSWSQTAGISQASVAVAFAGGASCLSDSECVAWIEAYGTTSWFLAYTTNSGSSWTAMPMPAGAANTSGALSCTSLQSCVSVMTISGQKVIAVTNDGGADWTGHALPAVEDEPPVDLACVAAGSTTDCWGSGTSGIVASTDDGSTWALQLWTAFELFGIDCPDATHCWAVDDINGIVTTSNGGHTWVPLAPPNPAVDQYNDISCADDNHCVAVGSPGAVAVTTNGGSTWTDRSSALPSALSSAKLNAVSCPSVAECFAVTGGNIIESTDGGSTWTQRFSTTTSQSYPDIACPSTSVCWAALGGLVETTDGGTSWTPATTPSSTPNTFAVSCPTTSTCWALDSSYSNAILTNISQPGCSTTWCEQPLPSTMGNGPNALSCPTTTTCWVTGFTSTGANTSAVTNDAGTTWQTYAVPSDTNYLSDISCPSSVVCFADGWSNADGGDAGLVIATNVTQPEGGPLEVSELIGGANPSEPCGECALAAIGLQRLVSDPVNTATGALDESYTDTNIPTFGPALGFTRSYDSGVAQTQATAGAPGPLGYGWSDNWSMSLSFDDPSAGAVTVVQENGSQVAFSSPSGGICPLGTSSPGTPGSYCAPPRVTATLAQDPTSGDYTLTRMNGENFVFNTTGELISESDAAGNTLNISYAAPPPGSGSCPAAAITCETVTSASGRGLVIAFDSAGLVTQVTDPLGRSWTYRYCQSGQNGCSTGDLVAAVDPAGDTTTYTYDSANPITNLDHDLLSVVDPNQQPGGPDAGTQTTFNYGLGGRIIKVIEPQGRTTTFAYQGNNLAFSGGATLETDPDGNQNLDTYIDGALTGEQKGYGTSSPSTSSYQRDVSTLLPTQITDPDGHITTIVYDTAGNTLSVTDPDGRISTYAYNNFGERTCAADPQATQGCDQLTAPAPIPSGTTNLSLPSSATPAHVTFSEYDTAGNLIWTTASNYLPGGSTPDSTTTSYRLYPGESITLNGTRDSCRTAAPAPNLPCATIDPNGTVTQLSYDAAGDTTATSVPDGNTNETATTSRAFDADGEQTTTVAPLGNLPGANTAAYTTTTTYDAAGRTKIVTQGSAGPGTFARTTSYGYDADGNRTSVTAPSGQTTITTFDANDQATLVADPDGNQQLSCYDGDGHVTESIPPAGVAADNLTPGSCPTSYPAGYATRLAADATTYTYDPLGDKVGVITPAPPGQLAPQTAYNVYDPAGRLTTSGQPSSDTAVAWGVEQTSVDYYWSGSAIASGPSWPVVIYPNSTHDVEGFTWWTNADNSSGWCDTAEPVYAATPNGLPQVQCGGSPTQSGTTTSYEIDDYGPYDSNGNDTDYNNLSAYSPDPNLPAQALSANASNVNPTVNNGDLTYSQAELPTPGSTVPLGPAAADHNPGGELTAYSYDPAGQMTSQTTAAGTTKAATTSYCYDPAGQQTAVIAPDGNTGSVASCEQTSPWHTTSAYQTGYSYDSLGQLVTTTRPATTADPSGQTTSYDHDPDGHLTATTQPDGVTTTRSYTPTGQLSSTNYSDTTPGITYAYDADGLRTQMTDSTGTTTYAYTNLDQPSGTTNPAGQTIGYSWEPDGQIQAITYPFASTAVWATSHNVSYSYDRADRLTTVTDPLGTNITINTNPDGQTTSETLGATTDVIDTAYAQNDQPQSISLANTATTLQSYSYTQAPNGSTATETDSPSTPTSPEAYSYSVGGNLSGATAGGVASNLYTTDPSGNLTTLPTGATATYNSAQQLASSTAAAGTTAYNYDQDGNRTSATLGGTATATATWNDNNELTSYTTATVAETNTYNGDGLRVASTAGPIGSPQQNSYIWDMTSGVPRLLEDSTNIYVYSGTNTPVEQINVSTGAPTYLITDNQGSVRATANAVGAVTGTISYDPWGDPRTRGGLSATTPFGFTGSYIDTTGLEYLIHRYYDPSTGQFISQDPLLDMTRSPYGYSADDPINQSDPLGLCNSNPLSPSFWINGNCISGLVGGPDGGGPETLGGVVKSVAGIAGAISSVAAVAATGGASILPAALEATDAATVAGYVQAFSGFADATVDCISTKYSACAWDLDTVGVGYLVSEHPGGFPGSLLAGLVTVAPNPYDHESSDSPVASTPRPIIEWIDGRLSIVAPSPVTGSFRLEHSHVACASSLGASGA